MLLQLASHSRIASRRLRSSESTSAKHDVRCVLAGVDVPDLGKDSTQGLSQRARYMRTLPRRGEPDPSLKDDLIGDTADHASIRGQVIGWALAMDRAEAIATLDDPEFRQQRVELQAFTDPISLFIDECFVHNDALVPPSHRHVLLLAFQAWCEVTNSTLAARSYTEHTLINQIRKVLSVTHRPRRSLTKEECAERGLDYNKRPKLQSADWGYTLRAGIVKPSEFHTKRLELLSSKRGEGGIQEILSKTVIPDADDLEKLMAKRRMTASTRDILSEIAGDRDTDWD